VVKVARKRWLPSQGIVQAIPLALRYKDELSSTGNIEDETDTLVMLLQNQTDYVAKPSHHSMGEGAWLVNINSTSGITKFGHPTDKLQQGDFEPSMVAESLSKSLRAPQAHLESWALNNVKAGFVIEERLVDFNSNDYAAQISTSRVSKLHSTPL
jgi:hypothetical protein